MEQRTTKAESPNAHKTVLYLPRDLVKKLKVYVAQQETSMSALARELLGEKVGWTEEVKTKKK